MRFLTTVIFSLFVSVFLSAQGFKGAMDSLLCDELFTDSDVSVAVYDLDDDTLVYAHRSAKMCRPASVLKLLTAGVALERLGVEYSICTSLGVSRGADFRNLLLKGEMDPLFSEQELDAMVASVGDSSVVDTLFVDCSFMDSIYWGPGWSWDDTPWEFQPYMSPLMLNGGCVDVSVKPSARGAQPVVECRPVSSYYSVANEAVSHDASCGKLTILRDWLDNSNVIRVRGNCVGACGERMNLFRSERFFVTVMCEKLAARGVSVGNVVYAASPDTFELLHCKQRSILEVVDEALKESNNLCAEALTFHLGALYGHRPVAHKDGTNIIKGFLDYNLRMPEKYEIADGSGLSLYTYISADIMLQMLRRIYGNSAVYEAVLRGLPVAGWTGTLKGRMAGTVAERKIRAKTGTVSGICTLAGYAEARNGHTLAFVIFNQNIMAPKLARRWQNKVCELMCR
ncbi:MAG: D-alanyl-D-alanine carboxypeptidase/D-alanyl-D-alanine-endopeptidase [Bacteroidaceae bacterium]|nr:D-alanyl-D-alanine carboxypeptidase/D-alanyl-D-alanine-endopeptidase [Bacteroidaceae bacterium]